MTTPLLIRTISDYHALRGLPKPKHPLISVINFDDLRDTYETGVQTLLFDYYSISIKRGMTHRYRYGQQDYDFNEGIMFFMAPRQVLRIEVDEHHQTPSGWMLLIHPDFLWNTPLAGNIKKYEFFDYGVHEALFLSEDEELKINQIIENIRQEYHTNIDQFSQNIIVSQLETLLNYADRFYRRQFITRNKANHQVLEQLEKLLEEYFNNDALISKGLPTVQYISDQLHVSPTYLRSLLKMLTGLNTQQLIHQKVIDKAKEKLSTTDLTVSEIAYDLGFEHPQSFNKFFKQKTSLTPMEFKQQFS
ncbi:helix-turn-helix domain-containing protein [Chitinophaga qingshengii]|uniref:AraC family transcriptional regulator n=1 Tax=Chitinophaga qingshengii TaxID=1569794 RepID=A0ABR7TT51_9BACT|nr:helix-turn-helix domain-containing protein [Chitinophaga qingshengii]MBC9932788.1 AraC family transcriptional regulator [Chitinophaga qingshengii]